MAKRTYDQYCPVARGLDVIGDRWTILIIRDLLLGHQRYTDLLEGLPGIGPNVLAERLRRLQDAGIVSRTTLPPPAASAVYELTELGEGLRPMVTELGLWGLNFLGSPKPSDTFRLSWLLRSMEGAFRPEAAKGIRETYEFRIDGEVLHVRVDDGTVAVRQGHAEGPDCIVTSDLETFMAVAGKLMSPEEAVASGRSHLEGDAEAAMRSVEILGPHFGGVGSRGGMLGVVRARLHPDQAPGVTESYEFRVDDQVFHVQLEDGRGDVRPGPAADPAFVATSDLGTLLAIGSGQLTVEEAIAAGRLDVEADPEVAERAWAVLDVTGLVPAAA